MKKNGIRTDYSKPDISVGQYMFIFLRKLVLLAVLSFIFYKSYIAFIALLPLLYFLVKEEKKSLAVKRRKKLQCQFKDGITILLSELETGHSVENAFMASVLELRRMYQKETDIEREFQSICRGIKLNEPIEKMLLDFAQRSSLEDVKNFADVFVISKKRGGNLVMILKSTISTIQQKIEVNQEIETLLSGKRLEQKVMSVVPIGILIYVNLTSPEFLDSLYFNIVGIAIMTGCMIVYGLAYYIGLRIIKVEI